MHTRFSSLYDEAKHKMHHIVEVYEKAEDGTVFQPSPNLNQPRSRPHNPLGKGLTGFSVTSGSSSCLVLMKPPSLKQFLMVISRPTIGTGHYNERSVDHWNWRIFDAFGYVRSVPRYFDQYSRLIIIFVIITSGARSIQTPLASQSPRHCTQKTLALEVNRKPPLPVVWSGFSGVARVSGTSA
ncbi:hypothetical protein AVEN_262552-1 [Araneus ventricosus]|uniref:Uncharacterized protein n=1 Tax=Araneus ventricosus TaxID=182803 RepID=A0A4Y2KUN0_ARAVE|nr:hypothetical protein AVEN_262552-1 [Araneus ventricosus]